MNNFSKKNIVTALGLGILALLPNCGGGCCKKEAVVVPTEQVQAVEEAVEKSVDAQDANVQEATEVAPAADVAAPVANDKV